MLNTNLTEKDFEDRIEAVLLAGGPDEALAAVAEFRPRHRAPGGFTPGGYRKREQRQYDKALCLDPELLYEFVIATQPVAWAALEKQYLDEARPRFFQRVEWVIRTQGTLHALRHGVQMAGQSLRLAYFPPNSGLNPVLESLCRANQFSVIRQLRYSERSDRSLDLALFLNGVPLFTAELKDQLGGQDVDKAIKQYRLDRDPKGEPLLAPRRCLAHFAVDPDQVWMTSHLEGPRTRFLPFNRGRDGGAGNPRLLDNFATAYLWEQVWAKGSVLDLVGSFVIEVERRDSRAGSVTRRVLFPRYHQLEVVRALEADAKANGVGRSYLLQHSAGSGKSNEIAWLAHHLAVLHDAEDRRVFDSVIVISDRINIDRQLGEAVQQFEQRRGLVERARSGADLRKYLEAGVDIIVCTLWKFPVIEEAVTSLAGKRFALIIDEAHSSQTGDAASAVNKVLRAATLEEAERKDAQDEARQKSLEDEMIEAAERRGKLKNASYFAFTATPKARTRELFGTRRADGSYVPFHLYTMRQAIDEEFILDVLRNYRTYRDYWQLVKTVESDPRYAKEKATHLLRTFVSQHPDLIAEKVAVMMAHFDSEVKHAIGGQARAMIVTPSRLHAVRYKQAVDQWLCEHDEPYRALVAFSGEVRDPEVNLPPYTEAQMNGIPETQTAAALRQDPNRILIVANKYQTGFDEPLLHTMYVDKRLSGVAAVQTLSRLNRVCPGKSETMVLDFANEVEDIQKAFQEYYDRSVLTQSTDPNLLYDLQSRLAVFCVYDAADVDAVVALQRAIEKRERGVSQAALHARLNEVVGAFGALDEDKRVEFARMLNDYIRLYAFLAQLIEVPDAGLEKLYRFARLLHTKLPQVRGALPVEVTQNTALEFVRVTPTGRHAITLTAATELVSPQSAKAASGKRDELEELLSEILREINERYGIPPEQAGPFIHMLSDRLREDQCLKAAFVANPSSEDRRLVFERRMRDQVQDMLDVNFDMFKHINDNPDFAQALTNLLCERYEQELEES